MELCTKRGIPYESTENPAERDGSPGTLIWWVRMVGPVRNVKGERGASIVWQNGTVPQSGRNGFQPEELLELVAERLRGLNEARPCRENSLAITKIEEAMFWLEERTRDRIARGAEGTEQA